MNQKNHKDLIRPSLNFSSPAPIHQPQGARVRISGSDEVMCAGWNPQLALVGERPVASMDKHAGFPDALACVNADTFLQKMYKFQR